MTDSQHSTKPRRPLFSLGTVVATPGALAALEQAGKSAMDYLERHQTGDWGDLSDDDRAENEFALGRHLRLFSAYLINPDLKIWIITEADRSSTTILLPEDY